MPQDGKTFPSAPLTATKLLGFIIVPELSLFKPKSVGYGVLVANAF